MMVFRPRAVVLISSLVAACATESTPPSSLPPRDAVRSRLEAAKRADPNTGLCERITASLAGGDRDALRVLFDQEKFVERVVAYGLLPLEIQQALQSLASTQKFGRLEFPIGSRFSCLGTRSLWNEPHIAIRHGIADRFDYLLVHLSGNAQFPLDDYMAVSGGHYYAEDNALFNAPELRSSRDTVDRMAIDSVHSRFGDVIAGYRRLPPSLQSSPVAFERFLNAVYWRDPIDEDLYREAFSAMEQILKDRPYSLAYWRFHDGKRRSDAIKREQGLLELLELLDDYELLEK